MILLRVAHGVGVSGDAKFYLELARAFSQGEPGLQWILGQVPQLTWGDYLLWEDETPLPQPGSWPLLYSALLAAGGGFAFDARDVAGPFNAVAFGLTIFAAGEWMRSAVRSPFLVVVGCAAILFSVTLSFWASWAFSEVTFILFSTLALLHADKFLRTRDLASLIWAAAFTALACLTRYPGIVLILALVPLMMLRRWPDTTNKLKHVGLFLFVSIGPLFLWLLRNYLVSGTLTGPRGNAKGGDIVTQIGRGLSSVEGWVPLLSDIRSWLLPFDIWTERIMGAMLAGAFLVALGAVILWAVTRWWRTGASEQPYSCLAVAGVYAYFHLAFTVVNTGLGNVTLTSRQFLPAFVPILIAIVVLVDIAIRHRSKLASPMWVGNVFANRTFMRGGGQNG